MKAVRPPIRLRSRRARRGAPRGAPRGPGTAVCVLARPEGRAGHAGYKPAPRLAHAAATVPHSPGGASPPGMPSPRRAIHATAGRGEAAARLAHFLSFLRVFLIVWVWSARPAKDTNEVPKDFAKPIGTAQVRGFRWLYAYLCRIVSKGNGFGATYGP